MSITSDPKRRSDAVNAEAALFERETRQSGGQYTHIEPSADDLGESTDPVTRHFPESADGTDEANSVFAVYDGTPYEELVPSAAYFVKEVPLTHTLAFSQVEDPENTHWMQSNVACSLEVWR